ncbi:wax ester/triacylglycerol synthase domain-containing protein [Streptomyces sp. NBC_00878]|uniref:wax ester/triacylglycerol synthase domain-containing protein n=1 Tax=Streptomyces sp. NBC_00878 TaxID=2975854 RepID=UPI00225A6F55|nr:wax ester/triacylglycerol synthase domain-containing protein [Streptomyces sp. NBC_00878]MCX4907708.1 WS/DGAT domain-containing protein [Streptomyces sp. NBC_00878]
MKMRGPDAIMALLQESCRLPVTAAAVTVFPGPAPTPEQMHQRVCHRLAPVGRLRLRPDTDGAGRLRRPYSWRVAEKLDVSRHVTHDRLRPGQRLEDAVADLVRRSMPEAVGGPLWELRVVQDAAPGHFALVLRAHHALLDGASLFTVLRLLGDDQPGTAPPSPEGLEAEPMVSAGVRTVVHAVAGMLPPAGRYPCNEPVDEGRTIGWHGISADVMEAARNALPEGRTSPNNVFLAAFTAAVRACPDLLGQSPRLDRAYAAVPVDLRGPQAPYALGNYVSAVRVRMPLETADPLARLREVGHQMRENKRLRRAEGMAWLADHVVGLGAAGARVFVRRLFGGRSPATFTCTFPRWGTDALVLYGRTAESVIAMPNLAARTGIMALLSQHADSFYLCLAADDAHRAYARPLAAAFVAEMHALAMTGGQNPAAPFREPRETEPPVPMVPGEETNLPRSPSCDRQAASDPLEDPDRHTAAAADHRE